MLISLILAGALAQQPAGPEAVPELAPLLPAVVIVRQGGALCSGAFMDDQGHVATAYHCVSVGGRPQIETRDGRRAVGKVVAWEASSDLAVIEVPDMAGEPFLPLREGGALHGEEVRAIGHPFGTRPPDGFMEGTLRWTVSQGIVSNVGRVALQVTAAVNPGNSGGPVVDGEGRLVAVVSRRLGGEAMGFAARADRIPELLDEPRGLGLAGGNAGLGVYLSSVSSTTGRMVVGVRLEATLRDRIVGSLAMGLPLDARWTALRFASGASYTSGEARLGLRQRLGRGVFTTHIDAFGGVLSHSTLTATLRGDDWDLQRHDQLAPMVGGAIAMGGTSLDMAWAKLDTGWQVRTMVTLSWPGTLWIF